VHYMALSVAAKIVYRFWLRHPVPMLIPFAAMALMALGFGIAVHLLVERPLLRALPGSLKKLQLSSTLGGVSSFGSPLPAASPLDVQTLKNQ